MPGPLGRQAFALGRLGLWELLQVGIAKNAVLSAVTPQIRIAPTIASMCSVLDRALDNFFLIQFSLAGVPGPKTLDRGKFMQDTVDLSRFPGSLTRICEAALPVAKAEGKVQTWVVAPPDMCSEFIIT